MEKKEEITPEILLMQNVEEGLKLVKEIKETINTENVGPLISRIENFAKKQSDLYLEGIGISREELSELIRENYQKVALRNVEDAQKKREAKTTIDIF